MNIQTTKFAKNAIDLSAYSTDFPFREEYGNFIGGSFVAPRKGEYFDNISPIDGSHICRIARSDESDINAALDAAYKAQPVWAKKTATERAAVLLKIADRIEENLEMLAVAETIDNGKAIRESIGGDIPAAADHFRYFASCIRSEEGGISHLDDDTYAYHVKEPLGVVGQIIPWNFPILMAVWKIAPAIAVGNAVVLKPAEQTPASIMVLMELIADILPAGVVNVVNGYGLEAGKPLASSPRIAKVAFTGETGTGRMISGYASQNLIPVTLELGGKSPNVFFEDIMDADDGLLDKAIEGFVSFALNQGEVCTCPSRAIIQESIYEKFMERALERVAAIKRGNALKDDTMIGAQVSKEQAERIENYIEIGKKEGAELLAGGGSSVPSDELEGGFYIEPTVFKGDNKMRIFQEEIFGPVVSVTTFKDEAEALEIANDTPYGLGAAVWTRDTNRAHRISHGMEAGRVWVNSYHLYPVHAAFGGFKQSGIGRETHKMVLDHYQQTKSIVASHTESAMGLF